MQENQETNLNIKSIACLLYKFFRFLSKHDAIACDSAGKMTRAMKTCFHKHEGGFLASMPKALLCFDVFSWFSFKKNPFYPCHSCSNSFVFIEANVRNQRYFCANCAQKQQKRYF